MSWTEIIYAFMLKEIKRRESKLIINLAMLDVYKRQVLQSGKKQQSLTPQGIKITLQKRNLSLTIKMERKK